MAIVKKEREKRGYINIVGIKERCPEFQEVIYNEEGERKTATSSVIKVNFEDVDVTKTKNKDGREYDVITFKVNDGVEKFYLTLNFNSLAPSIINSLVSLDKFEDISLSLYLKNDFVKCGLFQNDELVKWKYPMEDFKPIKYTTPTGKEEKDYGKRDERLKELVGELKTKLSQSDEERF